MARLSYDTLQPRELYEPLHYTLQNGGKRLRPALTLLACNVFNGNVDQAIPAALGIEIFHNFTLLHDDVMDNAHVRRGNPTVHKKWNENIAILSGDVMMIKAYSFLFETHETLLPTVLKVFNRTATEICEGQQLDMNFETRTDVSIPEYLRMIELKTSVLLACALQIGGMIGGGSGRQVQQLYDFGKNLGMAFQLQDDLLDTYADPEKFGKRTGGDIVANKKTFLLLSALEKANDRQRRELVGLMNDSMDDQEKIERVKHFFDTLNVGNIAEQKIMTYFNKALQDLNNLEVDEEHKTELLKVAHRLVKRDY